MTLLRSIAEYIFSAIHCAPCLLSEDVCQITAYRKKLGCKNMLLLQKGMLLNNIISGVLKNVSEQVQVAKNLDQRRPKIHYFF